MGFAERILDLLQASPGLTTAQIGKRLGLCSLDVGWRLNRLRHRNRVMRRSAYEHETPGWRWYVYARTVSPRGVKDVTTYPQGRV